MKRALVVAAAGVIAFAAVSLAVAQSESSGQKTLAATMEVYVFPTEGQSSEQQSKDEAECYNWAVGQTGNDPFDLNKQALQVLRLSGVVIGNSEPLARSGDAAVPPGRGS